MKTILILLLTCVAALAQQTVNNFTVKTNLVLRGLNVSTQLTPVPPSLATNWFNITTWGDSLTAGAGASPLSNAYPAVLDRLTGYTVSNGGIGGQTSTQIKTRMLADTNSHVNPTIIWAGRNNYTNTSVVLSDIADMVAALNTAGNSNRFLVMSILNGYGGPEDRGTPRYEIITNLNYTLSTIYGKQYVDIRSYLVSQYDPAVPQDVLDYANDVPPSTLRSDALHLNNDGYSHVANYLATNWMQALRGEWSSFVGAKQLEIAAASPPPYSILYSEQYRVGDTSSYRTISKSGDSTSFQFDGKLIPEADDNNDIGYDYNFRRWRNLYLSRAGFATNFISYSASWAPLVHVGNPTNYLTLSLSGDFASIQANGKIIPVADNTYDLGNSWNSYRWKDGYFSGTVYSTNLIAWTATYSPLFNVGTTTNYKTFSLSGDFTSVQLNGQFIPAADATYDLGYSDTLLRWRNANLTGTVRSTANIVTNSANTGRVMADSDYRGYKLLNNGGAGYAGGSAIDLFSIGGTPRMMSGILTIRTTWAGGNGIYTYVFGIVGSGTTTTISPTSFQEYGTGPTGTLTLQKDVPTAGSDGVRFTLGATAITSIEFMWKPLWVDGGSTIIGF